MSRLHGLPSINAVLAWAPDLAGAAAAVARPAPLRRLDHDNALSLAKSALGPAHAEHAEALVAAAGDVPLVTVVGAYFLATHAIDPRFLERHAEFQLTVLDRFADETTAATFPVGLERDLAARLLPLLAAVQPLRPEDAEAGAAIASFVGANLTDVLRTIGKFEESGVLLRRGGLVRIVPDVLADHLLHRACVTTAGAVTGYADHVFTAFRGDVGGAVLRNLSELDWRVRAAARIAPPAAAAPTSGPTVLWRVWTDVRKRFAAASNSARADILQRLHEVAYLQPEPVLEIVDLTMRTPATAPERGPAGLFVEWTHNEVLHRLPRALAPGRLPSSAPASLLRPALDPRP